MRLLPYHKILCDAEENHHNLPRSVRLADAPDGGVALDVLPDSDVLPERVMLGAVAQHHERGRLRIVDVLTAQHHL